MSEGKLNRELDNSRARAHADDVTKIAGTKDSSCDWINAAASRGNSTDVADRVVSVCMIEQVEEVRAKLKARRLANGPAL